MYHIDAQLCCNDLGQILEKVSKQHRDDHDDADKIQRTHAAICSDDIDKVVAE